ncbi:hypothetical protein ACH41H_14265 [Streptomyces sp. NPDC020800]|uniref:hypothetical protein n=1 Tax=Streptomyces sp. NPDC020800 TaxID=3365092 RepID=UPI00378A736C
MFDIRIICKPADTDHVVAALDGAFNAGTVTVYPSRDGEKNRLYVRADHKQAPQTNTSEEWPGRTEAYAGAPDAGSELAWLLAAEKRGREWWLRRAALVDRVASGMVPGHFASTSNAFDLACRLMALDGAVVGCNPRAYVRQQYAQWANNH